MCFVMRDIHRHYPQTAIRAPPFIIWILMHRSPPPSHIFRTVCIARKFRDLPPRRPHDYYQIDPYTIRYGPGTTRKSSSSYADAVPGPIPFPRMSGISLNFREIFFFVSFSLQIPGHYSRAEPFPLKLFPRPCTFSVIIPV